MLIQWELNTLSQLQLNVDTNQMDFITVLGEQETLKLKI